MFRSIASKIIAIDLSGFALFLHAATGLTYHVKGNNIPKRDRALAMEVDQTLVDQLRRRSRGQAEHERPLGRRRKAIDALDNVAREKERGLLF